MIRQQSAQVVSAINKCQSKGPLSKQGKASNMTIPQSSPLKLKRSASFIDVSPAKGSLIIE